MSVFEGLFRWVSLEKQNWLLAAELRRKYSYVKPMRNKRRRETPFSSTLPGHDAPARDR